MLLPLYRVLGSSSVFAAQQVPLRSRLRVHAPRMRKGGCPEALFHERMKVTSMILDGYIGDVIHYRWIPQRHSPDTNPISLVLFTQSPPQPNTSTTYPVNLASHTTSTQIFAAANDLLPAAAPPLP